MKTKILLLTLLILIVGVCYFYNDNSNVVILNYQMKLSDVSKIASVVIMAIYLYFLFYDLNYVYGTFYGVIMMGSALLISCFGWHSVFKFLLESWNNFVLWVISFSFAFCSTAFLSSLSVNGEPIQRAHTKSHNKSLKEEFDLLLLCLITVLGYWIYFNHHNSFLFFLSLIIITVMFFKIKFFNLPDSILIDMGFLSQVAICVLAFLSMFTLIAQYMGYHSNPFWWLIPSVVLGLITVVVCWYIDFLSEGNTKLCY